MSASSSARAAILMAQLALQPHPEGGHYRRIHPRGGTPAIPRPAWSAVHFLLTAGECSAWHRVDADEAWHYVEGAELELLIYHPSDDRLQSLRLGLPDADGCLPMQVVPAGAWQAARSLGAYSLVTCQVVPAFDFAQFSLLEPTSPLAKRLRQLAPHIGG